MNSNLSTLSLDVYQEVCKTTAIYDASIDTLVDSATVPMMEKTLRLHYCVLKLNGEAGELAEDVAKALRDQYGVIDENRRNSILKELGDVLWYCAAVATELDVDLSIVASRNLEKLQARKAAGIIQGDGSDR